MALNSEPRRMPILASASSCCSLSKASPATNSDMVKPIPARNPPPSSVGQLTPCGNFAMPNRTARKLNSTTPAGLPVSSATATAIDTGSVIALNSI